MSANPAMTRAAARRAARRHYVSVEVDATDVLEALGDEDLIAELRNRNLSALTGGKGDPSADRYVDAAFIAAERMPDCPQPIRDLLWHVHGRAI